MNIKEIHRFPRDKQIALTSDAIMRQVMYAVVPGAILATVFFGIGVVVQLSLAMLTALGCEWLVALLRKRKMSSLDLSSGLVTAILLAVSVPATAPYWLIITAVAFGLLLGKHVYGGMGFNIFNPAIVGFCAVYLSFSAQMSLYPYAYVGVTDSFSLIFSSTNNVDSLTGATQLAGLKANGFFDNPTTYHWWLNIVWLIGGIYLWIKKVSDWRLSVVFLGVFVVFTAIFGIFTDTPITTMQHIGLGALIFTACFIITDPTTAATGRLGRIVYAALAGFLAVIIRQYSNMPDSMAFAILLANLSAPMIDSYTKPQYVK